MTTTGNCSICGQPIPAGHPSPRCPDCLAADARDRYRVEEELARGGMGVIYLATDVTLNRPVAMKVMQQVDADPQDQEIFRARFLEEARITAQLDHPGIVPIHELGLDEERRPYFTMHRVKGQVLDRTFELARAERDGWNLSRAVGVMVKACQAVAFAHERGVIHRDLKPANVMVGRLGEVYVMDWGLAKVVGQDDHRDLRIDADSAITLVRSDRPPSTDAAPDSPLVTLDGTIVGTPAYMSPEQAEGRIEELDRASDVYSLGAILYTLLTGRVPYVAPGARVSPRTILGLVTQGPPAPIHELAPKTPPELAAICEKAMARRPSDRYATSLALAEDLQAYLDGRVVRAYRTGALAELRSWVARHRETSLVLALAVLALMLVGVVFAVIERGRAADLGERLARQYLRRGQAESERGNSAQGLHWMTRALAVCPERDAELRGSIHRSIQLWAQVAPAFLDVHDVVERSAETPPSLASLSGDGRRIACGWSSGEVRVVDVATGRTLATVDAGETPYGVDLDGAGEVLAVGSRTGEVSVWSVASGLPLHAPLAGESTILDVHLCGDGRRLVTACEDGTAHVWSLAAEPTELVVLPVDGPIKDIAFGPGDEVATATRSGDVHRWSTGTGELLATLHADDTALLSVAYSPDGSKLAAGALSGSVFAWSRETGESLFPPVALEGGAYALEFSPDGRLLLGRGNLLSVRTWSAETGARGELTMDFHRGVKAVTFSADGERILVATLPEVFALSPGAPIAPAAVHPLEGVIWALAFAPRGGLFAATSGGRVEHWPDDAATPRPPLPEAETGVWHAELSPDGRLLALGDYSGNARVYDWRTGALVAELEHPDDVRALAFGPDGVRLATACFDGAARVWDLASGRLLATVPHDGAVEDVDLSPDGETVLAAYDDGTARLWSAETGEPVAAPVSQRGAILAAEFSPDGRVFATGGRDRTARLWDAETLEPRGSVLDHDGWVEDLAFSPDGELLLTGCVDGLARLWSVRSGEALGPPLAHGGSIRTVAFDPAGGRVATAGDDGAVRVWTVPEPRATLADDLELYVEVLTDMRMDANGVIGPIPAEEWRALRERLAGARAGG